MALYKNWGKNSGDSEFFGSWYGPGGTPAYKGSQPFHKEGYPSQKGNFQENPWQTGYDWNKYSEAVRKDVYGRGNYSLMGAMGQAGLYDYTRLQAAGEKQVGLAQENIDHLLAGKNESMARSQGMLDASSAREMEMDALYEDYMADRKGEESAYFDQLFGRTGTGGVMGGIRGKVEDAQKQSRRASDQAVGYGKQALEDIKEYGVEMGQGAQAGYAARAEAEIESLNSNPNIPEGIRSRIESDVRKRIMGEGRQVAAQLASKAQDATTAQSNVVAGLLTQKSNLLSSQAETEMNLGTLEMGTRTSAEQWKAQRDDQLLKNRTAMKQAFSQLNNQIRQQTDATLTDWDARISGGIMAKQEIVGKSIASLMDQVTAQFAAVSSLGKDAVAAARLPGADQELMDKFASEYNIDFSRTSLAAAQRWVSSRYGDSKYRNASLRAYGQMPRGQNVYFKDRA